MSKLEELLKELCPGGVEHVPLKQACTLYKGEQLNKDSLLPNGVYPVINGGILPSGYWNEFNFDENHITISQGGASAGYVNFMTAPFWAGAHCHVVEPNANVDNRYLYHFLKAKEVELMKSQVGAGIPSVSANAVYSLSFPLPPLPVQRAIVRILDTFTAMNANLEEELTARRKQYDYLISQFFAIANGGHADNTNLRVKLGEIADIGTGSKNTNEAVQGGKYPFFVRSQTALWADEYEFDETAIITAGDGVGVGKVFHYVNGKYALHQRAYRIHINSDKVLPKYCFYYMKATFLQYIQSNMFNGSVASIRRPMLENYPIPVLPVIQQTKTIKILEYFELLIANIQTELALRRKQYEYYRDKLLAFKEA